MKTYPLLDKTPVKNYTLKAAKYIFSVTPALTISLIAITVVNGLAATVNASLTHITLNSMSSMLNNNQDFRFIIGVVALMVLAMIVFPILSSLEELLRIRITQKVNKSIKADLMRKMSQIEYENFDDKATYDLSVRTLSETEVKISQTFYSALSLLSNVISAIGISCVVISIAWWMFPLAIVGAVPMFFVKFKSSDELNRAEEEMTYFNRIATYISNTLLNKESMKEIKLFGIAGYLKDIWKSNADKSFKRSLTVESKYGKRGALVNILYVWVGTPLTFINILFVIQGTLTLADYLVLLNTVGTLGILLVHEIPNQFGSLRKHKLFWNDLTVLGGLRDVACKEFPALEGGGKFKIEFKNVYFRYPKCEEDVLKGVTFTINNGEKVAIAGENGAGKSTIIKLLLGLYTPRSGSVTVNGCETSAIPPQVKRKIMSCVFQDFTKYFLSVRENIGFGDIDHIQDTEKIKGAAVKGLADSFIQKMPQGYDTMLGNIYGDGTDLSEGQWQKINIAQAYNADSDIIILDEPTASLDPVAEAEVYHTFKDLSEDKTCLLVSHRLGSARIGGRILVIQDGRITEDGGHEELLELNGKYAAMYRAQSKWYQEG